MDVLTRPVWHFNAFTHGIVCQRHRYKQRERTLRFALLLDLNTRALLLARLTRPAVPHGINRAGHDFFGGVLLGSRSAEDVDECSLGN